MSTEPREVHKSSYDRASNHSRYIYLLCWLHADEFRKLHEQRKSIYIATPGYRFLLAGHRWRTRHTLCRIWLRSVTWSVFRHCPRWRRKMALGKESRKVGTRNVRACNRGCGHRQHIGTLHDGGKLIRNQSATSKLVDCKAAIDRPRHNWGLKTPNIVR